MSDPNRFSLRTVISRAVQAVRSISMGGSWASTLPVTDQRNLRWYMFDGLLASSQDAIHLTYLTLFAVALGAGTAEVGWMNALASISAVVLLIPGAWLAERVRQPKWLVVAFGGGLGRFLLLGLALLPFVFTGSGAVWAVIVAKVIFDGAANFSMPAWVAINADIVPMAWRGRYFSMRNIVMGVAGMAVTYLAGVLVTRIGGVPGYQAVYGLAFLFGMGATFCFAHIQPHAVERPASPAGTYSPAGIFKTLREDRLFVGFLVASVAWNFSLNIAGPFFSLYQVQVLKATPAVVGVLSIISTLAGLPGQRFFGRMNDRLGARRVLLVSGFLIPFAPLGWMLTTQPWHAVPVNLYAGFMWAGFSLASFNLLLSVGKDESRARYSAIYQIAVLVALAAGAGLGGVLAQRFGYHMVFLLSSIGRFFAMFLFLRLLREIKADG